VIKEIFMTHKDYGLEAPRDRSNWCIGIGGLFLCEYYAAKKRKDPNYQSDKLQKALERVVQEACDRMEDTGGWGHTMRVKIDGGYRELEVMSNWMLATLGACQRLGFKVPADKVKKAMQFIQDCCQPGKGDVGYSPTLKVGCPARTGGALFAYAMLGQQKNTLYPLMVTSYRSSIARTSEAHGSQAMGYFWSAVAARQIGAQEWRAYKTAFFPKIQANGNADGTFKVLTGTTAHAASLDHQWDGTYNMAILTLILQLDRGNLVFLGQKHS
jgi:hypothetical protein